MFRYTICVGFLSGLVLFGHAWGEDDQVKYLNIKPLADTFTAALNKNGAAEKFAAHRAFTKKLFDDSRGEKTFRDKTGNCRLPWVEKVVTDPIGGLNKIDSISAAIFSTAKQFPNATGALVPMLIVSETKPDIKSAFGYDALQTNPQAVRIQHGFVQFPQASTAQALEFTADMLAWTKAAVSLSFANLTDDEQTELRANLFAQTTGDLRLGHRFADAEKGRRTADLLEKIDGPASRATALALANFTDPSYLELLSKVEADGEAPKVAGVAGTLLQRIETPQGTILIGGKEANEYQLDELADVSVVIDQGGNDTYVEGTTTEKRPVLIVIDLAGDDTYRGTKPGIQGSAILGASLLVDQAGNDTYAAVDVAQGSALGGVGILVDTAGNDKYVGDRRVQGQATGGFGLLLDRAGDDKYRAALLAQGCGGPLGVGVLVDLAGTDHYFAGGKYPGGYDDTPGFGGWSQGVGIGPRGVANGGIGMILDGGGDDIYEADYFSHGGGYWFAAGVARDFGGNDQRVGATRENFDGTPRTEPRFVRWGTGYGCHYAAGFVIDDTGNDTYEADFAVIGYAWDIAVAGIIDLAGDDKYVTQGSGVCQAHNSAVAFLFDKSGSDVYQGGIGATTETTDYHPDGGSGNYTLLLDEAGEDKYGQDLKNGQEQLRGWAGALLIDRP